MNQSLACSIQRPTSVPIPLVLDSPHSNFDLPEDFRPAAPVGAIRTGWDAYLDDLWAGATQQGATLISARFPRTYIDANRAEDDIDEKLLDAPWPQPLNPSDYARRGQGLIRRFALPDVPMYDRLLSVAEVEHRLNAYYRPYRAALAAAIGDAMQRFGRAWHIDLHSMKSKGNAMNTDAGQPRPDFVISDRMGTSSDPKVTAWIAQRFRELGYDVAVNAPYKGGDIVRTFGKPERQQHSVQIEINRAIYMDERNYQRKPGFPQLAADMAELIGRLADTARRHLAPGC